jgi:hypothetical protein
MSGRNLMSNSQVITELHTMIGEAEEYEETLGIGVQSYQLHVENMGKLIEEKLLPPLEQERDRLLAAWTRASNPDLASKLKLNCLKFTVCVDALKAWVADAGASISNRLHRPARYRMRCR